MTRAELNAELPLLYIMALCYDETYAKPTADYLLNKFYPWFKQRRRAAGVAAWTRKNDYDNFARSYCTYAQDAHAISYGSDAEALAVGEFCYISDAGAHAIVIAITDEGLLFIEPQTGQRIALTPKEISTCFHIAF